MTNRFRRARRGVVSVTLALTLGVLSVGAASSAAAAEAAMVPRPAAVAVVGLRKGSSGEAVRSLQQALVRAGVGVVGGVDGYFGSATESSVRYVQRQNGLSVTGVVSERTAAVLGFDTAAASSSPAAASSSSSSSSSSSGPTLGLGSTGEAVRQVQQRLIDVGFPIRGGADGTFGASTVDAIRDFQEAQGYKITGRTNPATMKALGLTAGTAPSASAPAPVAPAGAAMGRGARGSSVKALQQALVNAGIAVVGGADGVFGTATENALKSFQQSKGLGVTGTLDDPTAAALGLNGQGSSSAPATSVQGLQLGARGPAVVELQQRIIALGWPLRGGADGIFGAATQTRVLQFQKANQLPATGVVDERSARILGLSGSAPAAATTAASTSTASGYARYDERGARVVTLQTALINAGIAVPGGADGIFGSSTAGAVMSFQRAKGLTVSGKVDASTAAALGLAAASEPAAAAPVAVALEAKPVQAPCDYRDTWNAARSNGRVHLGTDILAAEGRELYAVASGTVTKVYADSPGSLSGNGLKIARADGTYFFYGHLSALATGIVAGTPVTAGQLVGYVGRTGNAGTPHLHLEVHPGGGAAVNPYPIIGAIGAC